MKMRISLSGIELVPYGPGEFRASILRAVRMLAAAYATFVVAQTLIFFALDRVL